jgi:fermentation-respiration switch protein FrsA (DUF1100 family)
MFVDYDGYGLNEGRTHYLNMYEQALAVYDYAAALPYVDNNRISVMGFSIGTGSAVYLAAHRNVSGLILAAPYANGYDLYNNLLPIFFGPMRVLVRQKLPSDSFAPDIDAPVLVIASKNDEIIPFKSSERLSQLFSGPVTFYPLEHARHNDIFNEAGIYLQIVDFLSNLIN